MMKRTMTTAMIKGNKIASQVAESKVSRARGQRWDSMLLRRCPELGTVRAAGIAVVPMVVIKVGRTKTLDDMMGSEAEDTDVERLNLVRSNDTVDL